MGRLIRQNNHNIDWKDKKLQKNAEYLNHIIHKKDISD